MHADLDFDRPEDKHTHEKENCLDNFVIAHDNCLLVVYNRIIIILKVISGILSLLLASFRNESVDVVHEFEGVYLFANIMELIFLFDFVLTFFKEFLGPDINSEGDKPYSTIAEISENYIKGELVTDLIPLIPLHLL